MDLSQVISRSSKRQRTTCTSRMTRVFRAVDRTYIGNGTIKLPPSSSCRFCHAVKIGFECPTMCCYNGQVMLAPIFISDALVDLYTRNDKYSSHFRQYSCVYNNFFAFSSLGDNIHSFTKSGVHTLSLQGQIYHFLPHLLPEQNKPNFLHMYFYDGALELYSRMKRFSDFAELLPEVIQLLMSVTEHNPYVKFFRSLKDVGVTTDFRIKISKIPVLDQTVFNAPTSTEVAAIFVEDLSPNVIHSPDIVVYAHGDHHHKVMHFYGYYDPLQYPLIFSRGESGWHKGLPRSMQHMQCARDTFPLQFPTTSCQDASELITREVAAAANRSCAQGKEVSCREYYAFCFQIRSSFSIVNMGRAFLQYIVDIYVKIENTHLDYLRNNQKFLRSELYQGIVDSVNDGVRSASSIGRRLILPASFIGVPRDIKRRYLNAMALVQHFGKPDLFITMTCTPHWPQITELLEPGESHYDRPDIVTRIFHSKLAILKNELSKKHVFGMVAARVDVIEFQKCGLPHAHLLVILESSSKILNPDSYDLYVTAEFHGYEETHLRSLVIKHMMHGPCGAMNPKCPCMKTKDHCARCRFNYPKNFVEQTTCSDSCYPVYKSRNNGDFTNVKGQRLDNRWVIPYNPYLLAEFDCHINVEICSTVKAVKYIYKYVYKGQNRVSFNIEQIHLQIEDEISVFQSARWVSPPEAAWRILGFEMYDMYPPVIPLQVHLPNMQYTTFCADTNMESLIRDDVCKVTMLTGYFTANATLESAKRYLYYEFPEWFVWDSRAKKWTMRKQRSCIGRMTYVSPSEGERYYLRLLLCNIRGAMSFDDLLTIDGCKYSTFKDACKQYGFIDQDYYADACMEEAAAVQMPHAPRCLFVTLLVFVDGVDPRSIWKKFYPSLSEDFARAFPGEESRISYLTYNAVEKYLESMGKKIGTYNLPVQHVCMA